MGEGNIKNYQVNYTINATGNAVEFFSALASSAEKMTEPLKALQLQIKETQGLFTSLKNMFNISPTVNVGALKTGLDEAQKLVNAAAANMGKKMKSISPTMLAAQSKGATQGVEQAITALKKQLTEVQEKSKAIGKTNKGEKAFWDDKAKSLKEQLAILQRGGAKMTKAASSIITGVQKHQDITATANAITKLNTAVNGFSKKRITVKVDADVSRAMLALNNFLETARSSVATVPLAAKTAGGTKGGGKKAGTGTTGQENVLNVKTKLVNNNMASQLTTAISEMQKLANQKPIVLKGVFSLNQAGYQLTQMAGYLQKLANSKPIILNIEVANNAKKISNIASALKKYNTAVSEFNGRKGVKLKINADDTKAVSVYDKFMAKVRDTVATIPLSAQPVEQAKSKGKSANKTKGAAASVSNVATKTIKDKEQVVNIKTKLNGGDTGFQLNRGIARLQELANEKPVQIRGIFNGGDAAFQLNQAIHTLQKLANSKPVTLSVTTNTPPSLPNKGVPTAPPATTTTTNGNGSKQANANTIKPSDIRAYTKHAQSMSDLRLAREMEQARMAAVERAKLYAKDLAKYESLWGVSGNASIADNSARHNAKELDRVRKYVALHPYGTPQSSESTLMPRSTSSRRPSISPVPIMRPQGGKSLAYVLTGNTSFGARTPMAVDMAKGMGTMFAIGGAMSAVGSSLSQAIEYQNVMKTTGAILKNGTDNYSDSAFKGMEGVVRQVGKDTKFTAPQVAHAAKFLAMAGYDIPEINAAIKPVSNIALIGDTDLGTTADKLTNVMTTFGIAPEKMNDIADIMTTTFTRSNTDMMMLAESAKYAGGIANLYGGSFKNNFADVMAMFGVLGNAGIQASSAGTTLRMMYQNLMQPNKKQKATLKKYGIFTRDNNGNPLEMVDILKQISAKVPENKLADAIGQMFRITAQPGASALATHLNGKNGLIALMEANRNAAGSGIAKNIANEKKNTVAGLWAQVRSAFTEGILQAFEGKEGGWAGQLAEIRDYLSKPETVDMLKSVLDLVENLVKIIGKFAKIYMKVYHMFPGVINGWMKFQLFMTQLGFLYTPIVQLSRVLNILKAAFVATTSAATTAAVAERTAAVTRKASTAAGAVSGTAPFITTIAGGGLAMSSAKTIDSLKNKKMAYVRKANILKNSVQNADGSRRPISPLWFAPMASFGRDSAESQRFLQERQSLAKYDMALQGKMAQHAQDRANAIQSQINDIRRSARRPKQLQNPQLMKRYRSMWGDVALIAMMRQRPSVAAAANKRHAVRGAIASDVRNRFAQRYGFKKAAGMSWKTSFSAGRAIGTLSLASMAGSLKSMALSLFSGLAKAIGMITSPIGLVTLAIGAAVTATIVQINRIKKAQAQSDQKAKNNAEKAHKARMNVYKPIDDINKKYRTIGDMLTPAENNLQKSSAKEVRAKYLQYIDAFDTTATDSIAQKQWLTDIINNRNTTLAFDNRALSFKEGRKISGKRTFEESINYMGDQIAVDQLMMQQMDARNTNGANSRAWEALYLAGATNKQVITAQRQIMQLREKLIAKKITQDVFNKKASKIRAIAANPNAGGLLNATDYTAQEIKNNTNWSQFAQYQQGGWNVLTAELNADIGTISGYLQGVDQLKNGVKQYSDQWWQAIARVYDGMKYPLEIAGKTTNIVLNALPNGRIDTSRIIEQIQQIANNLQLNISDFAKMASSIYEAMAKIGVVPGKYYSDFMKFTWSQVQHSDVTATDAGLYFDQYIAKGNKNATWGGLNRQQYIDYVKSGNGNKGRAAKERAIIRKTMSNNAAINSKRQYDKAIDNANKLTGNGGKTDKGSTTGSNAGTDNNKSKNQKEYANTYDRSAARPTQVIINIDNLARFDRTAIAGNSDERAIAEAIETKIAEAVAMISAQALNSASGLISQGV